MAVTVGVLVLMLIVSVRDRAWHRRQTSRASSSFRRHVPQNRNQDSNNTASITEHPDQERDHGHGHKPQ
jgi:hypothetical protein